MITVSNRKRFTYAKFIFIIRLKMIYIYSDVNLDLETFLHAGLIPIYNISWVYEVLRQI